MKEIYFENSININPSFYLEFAVAEHFVRDSICSFDCGINLPHLSCQTLTFLFFPNNLSMKDRKAKR